MIIEIKNLPEGRKVKHINVDISFEEDGSVEVKTKAEPSNDQRIFTTSMPAEEHERNNTPVSQPQIPTEREHKEVPPEMKDLEF